MRCWLFCCVIFVLAYYTDEHLVVLEQGPKEKRHENEQVDTPSNVSEDGVPEKSVEDDAQTSSAEGQPSNEQEKLNSEPDTENDDDQTELSEGNSASQSDSEDQSDDIDKKSNEGEIYIIEMPNHSQDNPVDKARKIRNWNRWVAEVSKGNNAEIMGTNPHTYQPDAYYDLGRRFVPQYPYTDANKTTEYAPLGQDIVPIQVPKEVVAVIAGQSAQKIAEQNKNVKNEEVNRNKILRTGDYWNAVWKEDVNPKKGLRSQNNPVLGVVRAKIKPGNEFYNLVAKMKKISPRLLYIINEKKAAF